MRTIKWVLRRSCFFLIFTLIAVLCSCGEIKNRENAVSYVSMWQEGESQAEYLKEMADAFKNETGKKINIRFVGRDVLTKVKSSIMMNNPPDLIDQDFSELAGALITKQDIMVEPINDLFYNEKGPEGQNRVMDIFNENMIKLYEREGKLYFFPYEYTTSGFFYNKALFSKHNLNPPQTWDEFIKVNEVLKSNGIAALALDGTIDSYNAYYFYWAVERIIGPGGLRKAAEDSTGKIWDSPGYLEAARLVYQLSKAQKNYFQAGYNASQWPAAQVKWASGKVGSILCGTWIPDETRIQAGKGFEYGFYPFPEVESGKGRATDVEAVLIGCAIPRGAKYPQSAREFLKFLMRKENASKLVSKTRNISAREDTEYPKLLADLKPIVDGALNFHIGYDGAMAELAGWFKYIFYNIDNQLISGDITPEEFIAQMKEKTIDYLSSNK
jgi:ABC-type glycerol-3-phosphate transport system substrate-binding protein